MPVITISSQFGAGGPAVGKRLAERMGVDYLDKEFIHQIALDLDVPKEKVEEFEEARHSKMRGFLSTVFDFDALRKDAVSAGAGASEGSYDDREEIPFNFQVKGWIDKDIYKQMMVRVVSAVAKRGSAVIKGRGSQVILKDAPGAIHVRFVADREDRIANTMKRRGLSRAAATQMIDEMDERGAEYVQNYFDCDMTDTSLYHLVLNTSRIPQDDCLEILATMAEAAK